MRYLLLLTVLISGCVGSRTNYVHQEKGREHLYKDISECEKEVRSVRGPRARGEMRHVCLESRGWKYDGAF